jgi:hypothetical protein
LPIDSTTRKSREAAEHPLAVQVCAGGGVGEVTGPRKGDRRAGSVPAMAAAGRRTIAALLAATVGVVSACGSEENEERLDPAARVVELPGAASQIDFDDIVYSKRLDRVLVPARQSGLYVVDPQSGSAERLGRLSDVDSADEGRGLVFALHRDDRTLDVVDPGSGRVVASATTQTSGDYVRYVAATDELWVSQPAADPPGIEIFSLSDASSPTPRRAAFVEVAGGAEGLTVGSRSGRAYTHAGSDVAVLDVSARRVSDRWTTGCGGTHGFPRVDDRGRFVLASCSDGGRVVLLDARDGRELGRYAAGGGEALPAYWSAGDRFYVRGDPGTRIVTLNASSKGLAPVDEVRVPEVGHCLTADAGGHVWTCDAARGRVLRFPGG